MRILPETFRKSRGAEIAVVLAVVLAAVWLRFLPIRKGLPYLHDWDEPQIASTALHMMKTGEANPRFFHYGSLTIYAQLAVDVAHYLYLLRREPIAFPVVPGIFSHEEIDLGAIETWFETGFLWEVSHPSFYLWNRGFNALLGAATVWVTYLLGRALAGVGAGLLAAALLAVQGFHVERSAIVNPDVAMTLFALAAVYASVVFCERARTGWFVAALAFCGLAAGAKYNGIYCGSAPLAALLFVAWRRPVPRWLWAALPAVPIATFLATTPYALLDLPAFLSQAGFELYHYAARGHGAVPVEAGWEHLAVQLRQVGRHFGTVPAVVALGGAGLLIRRRRGIVALVFPVFYFLYMATTRAAFHRNLLPIYPLLAIGVAVFVLGLAAHLEDGAGGPSRGPKAARAVLAVLVAAHLGHQATMVWSSGWELWNRRETRSEAVDAVVELGRTAGPGFRVGLAEELRIHRVDLERLDLDFDVRPHTELVCDPASYDLVVTGARYAGLWSTRPDAKRKARLLNEATLEGVTRREIGGPLDGYNVTRLDAASQDPVVYLYSTKGYAGPLPEICAQASRSPAPTGETLTSDMDGMDEMDTAF